MDRYRADILFTMSGAEPAPIRDGIVDVEADQVVWSGPASDAPSRSGVGEQAIEGILMPGLIDTHCHTPMVLLRGAGEGLPVDRWLQDVMWPREAKLTADDVRVAMRLGAAELLTNGITTSVEMYFHSRAVAEAASAVGLRTVATAPILEDVQLAGLGTWEDQLTAIRDLADEWADHPLVDIGLGPHAVYSVSDECMRAIVATADETGMLVHIHVAEQAWEDATVRERTGMSAPEYLASLGMLEHRVLAAHAVWMSDTDIELFADNAVSVAHCPCSNTKHASGIARVQDMVDAGITVTIATDGPASHHRLDLFEEMRTAIRLSRVSSGDAQRLSTDSALWMTTAGAAEAIGRTDLGRLTPGSKADMIALTGTVPALNPVVPDEDDPAARIVWSGSPAAVTDVWVAGDRVVEAGRLAKVDQAAAIDEATVRARRLAR